MIFEIHEQGKFSKFSNREQNRNFEREISKKKLWMSFSKNRWLKITFSVNVQGNPAKILQDLPMRVKFTLNHKLHPKQLY